jgi:hypothetical protein
MNQEQLKKLGIVLVAVIVIRKIYFASTATSLQDGIEPTNIKPDTIQRALTKLTRGDVMVNDTPEETKQANANG